MADIKLTVRISEDLKARLLDEAKALGFSGLSDIVRHKLGKRADGSFPVVRAEGSDRAFTVPAGQMPPMMSSVVANVSVEDEFKDVDAKLARKEELVEFMRTWKPDMEDGPEHFEMGTIDGKVKRYVGADGTKRQIPFDHKFYKLTLEHYNNFDATRGKMIPNI